MEQGVREVVRNVKSGIRLFWQALALQLPRDPSAARAIGDGLFLLYSRPSNSVPSRHRTAPSS